MDLSGISFTFSKKIEKKQIKESSKLEKKNDDPDLVYSIQGQEIHSSKKTSDTSDFVIPLIKQNVWRVKEEVNTDKTVSEEDKLLMKAVNEIKAEANKDENGGTVSTNMVIPLLMQNKVPEGYETDDKIDVSIRPDESTDADYEQVPIESYGLAMLKGMGWKPGQAVGARCKKPSAILEPVVRSKGLGLGADRSALDKIEGDKRGKKRKPGDKVDKDEDELTLGKNSYVKILSGPHKDLYGQVNGLDEDNNRVLVKLTVSSTTASVSKNSVECVNRKDYDKYSKYLNKGKVEEYYNLREEKGRRETERRERSSDGNLNGFDDLVIGKEKKTRKEGEDKRNVYKKDNSVKERGEKPWLCENLLVRFIDKSYKHGKYYNTKMVIVDVTSSGRDECVCECSGKLLENISSNQLETLIPKEGDEDGRVMILYGTHRYQIGRVVSRDKSKHRASIQLLNDIDVIVDKLSYDDICHYVGR